MVERLPRFERKPTAIPRFEITARDEEILKIVGRHRFIRSSHIVALISASFSGTSEQQVLRRLQLLFHAGYLSRPKVQVESYRAGAGSRPLVYILGNHGIDILAAKHGFRRASVDWTAKARTASRGEIDHALEITDFMVALDLACRRRGTIELIYFDEIMRDLAPPETQANPRPYHWPVSVRWGREETTVYVIPDKTFGIRDLERPEGRNRKFFFLEADRGTMPVVRSKLVQSSLLRKLIGYSFTYKDDHHRRVYGLPNFRVLTVVPSRQRIATVIAAHQRHIAEIASPRLFLFADKSTLFAAKDLFDYAWVDGANVTHELLE
jgi:hypothetical protein